MRRAVTLLSQEHRIALFLDRRVDPDQKVDLSVQNLPLEEVLNRIADEHGFAVTLFGSVGYLGPPEATAKLRTLAILRREEAHRFGAEIERRLVQPGPLRWDDLATPRELLAGLAEQSGVTIAGMDRIPHDLWAAADLPSMSLIDRLTLLAMQFDLTFQISSNGRTLKLVPAPEDVAITREYPAGRQAEALAAKWADLLPDSRFRVSGGNIVVRGSARRSRPHHFVATIRQPNRPQTVCRRTGRRPPWRFPGSTHGSPDPRSAGYPAQAIGQTVGA